MLYRAINTYANAYKIGFGRLHKTVCSKMCVQDVNAWVNRKGSFKMCAGFHPTHKTILIPLRSDLK